MENSSSSSSSENGERIENDECRRGDVFDRFFARDVSNDEEWLQKALAVTVITRAFCRQPPRSQLIILCQINEFFTLCDQLSFEEKDEALKRYINHLRLEERIKDFYQRGYPSDIRPCDALPEDVRDFLCTCFGIISFCEGDIIEHFLYLRPPVLFHYTVKIHMETLIDDELYALKESYPLSEHKDYLEHSIKHIIKNGLVDLFDYMIESKIPIRDDALKLAIQYGRIEIFDRIVAAANHSNLNKSPDTPQYGSIMHHVIDAGNDSMYDRLIMYGFDVNLRQENVFLGLPLEYAFFCGEDHFVERLLDCGARVDFEPVYGITLLNLAVVNAFPSQLIKRLIIMGLDPRKEDNVYGNTQDVVNNLLSGKLRTGSITYTQLNGTSELLQRRRNDGRNDRQNLFNTMKVIADLYGEIQMTWRGMIKPLVDNETLAPIIWYHVRERGLRRDYLDFEMEDIEVEHRDYAAGENHALIQHRLNNNLGRDVPFDGYYTEEEIAQREDSYYPMNNLYNASSHFVAMTPDIIRPH